MCFLTLQTKSTLVQDPLARPALLSGLIFCLHAHICSLPSSHVPSLLLKPRPSCCLYQKALSWGASLRVALLSSRLLFRCSVLEEVFPAACHPSLPAVIGRTHWCLLSPPPPEVCPCNSQCFLPLIHPQALPP